MAEIKSFLRKLDFPAAIYETFRQVQKLISSDTRPPPYLAKELCDEFIFMETTDRRGASKRRKFTSVRELQILEILCTVFNSGKPDVCQKLFYLLFPTDPKIMEKRISLLTRAISLAVVVKNANFLNCAGFWMHTTGCTSESSMHIVRTIVNDYFSLVPTSSSHLKDLSSVSPLFCASLTTTITHLTPVDPMPEIIDLVASWIRTQPYLCFTPLEILPPQMYSQRPQTFLPGLVLWCVLSPLTSNNSDEKSKEISYLHFALLEMLLRAGQLIPRCPQLYNILPAEALLHIIETLKRAIVSQCATPASIELSLNRLGHVLQAALSSGCLQSNVEHAFHLVRQLPPNRLLKIVISRWEFSIMQRV